MGEKLPQTTDVLIKRLRRVAKWHDATAETNAENMEQHRARANTCWQSAARLEELLARIRQEHK